MRRGLQVLKLLGFVMIAGGATSALAQEPVETDTSTSETSAPPPLPGTPAPASAETTLPPPAPRPKFGDVSTSGYFRGSFGASNQKGRMTCFQLATGLVSKYRLGNECEVWG